MTRKRKERKIVIREDRLSRLDGTKMEVALWLLAKGTVEDRTKRPQPAPPESGDDCDDTLGSIQRRDGDVEAA